MHVKKIRKMGAKYSIIITQKVNDRAMYIYMYLSYISPSIIIHTEITSLTKKGRNYKQNFKRKNKMRCRVMIDHDVPAKRYGNKVRMSSYYA